MTRAVLLLTALAAFSLRAAEVPPWAAGLSTAAAGWESTAPAVALLQHTETRWQSAAQLLVTQRRVVLVRSAAGRDRARFAIGYNPNTDRVVSARAWVIAPDGRSARLFGRADFLDRVMQFNRYFWDYDRVIEFDGGASVQEGGAVAWELQLESHPGFAEWSDSFLPGLPTWEQSYDALPLPGGRLEWYADNPLLQHPAPGAGPGSFHWELRRLREPGEGRPLHFLPVPATVFVRTAEDPPVTWQTFAARAASIMLPSIRDDAAITTLARGIVAGKTERWDRIRALTEWVQSQVVYLAIRLDKDNVAGYRPHPTPEILRNRYGDCKDKASLLIAMLRAVGEDGRIVLLDAENAQFVDDHWPSARFNHAIVAIPGNGPAAGWPVVDAAGRPFVIFDPTHPYFPLGVLPLADQGGWALIVDPERAALVRLPLAESGRSLIRRDIRAELRPDGTLAVAEQEEDRGYFGAEENAMRRADNADHFARLMETALHRSVPLLLDFQVHDDWEPVSARFRLQIAFKVPAYGRPLGNHTLLMVSPAVVPLRVTLPAWRPNLRGRSLLGPDHADCTLTLTLPAGYAVEELPDAWTESAGGGAARLDYRQEGGSVVGHAVLERPAGLYTHADYDAVRGLYARFLEQQKQPILVRLPPAHS